MATSLLDWIMDLMRDGSAREAFNANPQAAMASAGFTEICGADVRPFLFDEPSIREAKEAQEVLGVSLPEGDTATEPDIRYIINNYTIELPDGNVATDGPNVDGPITGPISGDGNTVTQAEANITAPQDNDTDNSVASTVDNDTQTDTQVGNGASGTVVAGDGSAGHDRITDSTISDTGQDINGDGNTSILVLTDNLNDLHVLSDLVNVEDTLNDSPILNESLTGVATNAAQNAQDLINVL